jgi:Mlc titration factor MtfA (ptsG expression regulator)
MFGFLKERRRARLRAQPFPAAWREVLEKKFPLYTRLSETDRRELEAGRETVLDEYGVTNPAEFFAVATKCFFEKPHQLRKKHPELYDELKQFYRQDPVNFALPVSPQR